MVCCQTPGTETARPSRCRGDHSAANSAAVPSRCKGDHTIWDSTIGAPDPAFLKLLPGRLHVPKRDVEMVYYKHPVRGSRRQHSLFDATRNEKIKHERDFVRTEFQAQTVRSPGRQKNSLPVSSLHTADRVERLQTEVWEPWCGQFAS